MVAGTIGAIISHKTLLMEVYLQYKQRRAKAQMAVMTEI
jgi:hypothetical protein